MAKKDFRPIRGGHRFIPREDMPNVADNVELYEQLRREGRLLILKETAANKKVREQPSADVVRKNVRDYLRPIDGLKDDSWSEDVFNTILDRLLGSSVIIKYVGEGRCRKGVRPDFNKGHTYRLIGELRRRHVYQDGGYGASCRDFEQMLENSYRCRYHSRMSEEVSNEVESEIVRIIQEFK